MSEHTPTCATGARAEIRGPCDCGAVIERPYQIRLLDSKDGTGRRLVDLQVRGALTTAEATELSITIQELTKQEGERWARGRASKRKSGGA